MRQTEDDPTKHVVLHDLWETVLGVLSGVVVLFLFLTPAVLWASRIGSPYAEGSGSLVFTIVFVLYSAGAISAFVVGNWVKKRLTDRNR